MKDRKTTREDKPKLSVYTDREMMKRLRREKADTDRSIGDLVNARLNLSFQVHPEPLHQPEPASA